MKFKNCARRKLFLRAAVTSAVLSTPYAKTVSQEGADYHDSPNAQEHQVSSFMYRKVTPKTPAVKTSKRQCLAHLEDYIEKSPIKSHVGRTLFRRFIVNQVKEYGKHIKMIPQLDEKDQAVNSLLKDREIAESEFASRSIVGKKHCLVFAVLLYGLVHELYPNHAPMEIIPYVFPNYEPLDGTLDHNVKETARKFHQAIERGQKKTVKKMLKEFPGIERICHNGTRPEILAASLGRTDIRDELELYGLGALDSHFTINDCIRAARSGQLKLFKEVVMRRAYSKTGGKELNTELLARLVTAIAMRRSLTQLLFKRNPNKYLLEAVKTLMDWKADPEDVTEDGKTALQIAEECCNSTENNQKKFSRECLRILKREDGRKVSFWQNVRNRLSRICR